MKASPRQNKKIRRNGGFFYGGSEIFLIKLNIIECTKLGDYENK
jgi:hypothetical protein